MDLFKAAEERKMIDRVKMIEVAMDKEPDPEKAMQLAQRMIALAEGRSIASAAVAVAQPPEPPSEPVAAPADAATPPVEPRHRRHWRKDEAERAAALLDEGKTYKQVGEAVGRTAAAILSARRDGTLPVKVHKLNDANRLMGVLSAAARGQVISPRVAAELAPVVKAHAP